MKRNAILFSRVDREDFWVTGGIVFKVENTKTYEDAYNEIKHKIETPEMINYIIEDNCLDFDLFNEDKSFKLCRTYWRYSLYFVFKNDEDEEVEFKMSADFVFLA